jgi:2-polyprenyl-3-methyl-5-hydroxy-6-metoxy-1,4-benzoquinol methylase
MDDNAQGRLSGNLARFISRQEKKRHLAAAWGAMAGLRPGMVVVDIGSGPGVLALEYARIAAKVYALDPNVAPQFPADNLTHLAQDAASPINLSAPPDIFFLTDTLHHAADPAAILRNVHAASGPETNVFIAEYDPAGPGLVGARPHRRLAPATLLSLLAEQKFAHGGIIAGPDEHYTVLARLA